MQNIHLPHAIRRLQVRIKRWTRWLFLYADSYYSAGIKGSILEIYWSYKKGFYLESMRLYGFPLAEWPDYMSDREFYFMHPVNREYSSIIDNKLYLPYLFKNHPELVPEYYYLVEKGNLLNLDGSVQNGIEGLLHLLRKKHRLVLKPCASTLGEGFGLLGFESGAYYLNNKSVAPESLIQYIAGLNKYIVTEYVIQHEYSARIHSASVNTVRLLCIRDQHSANIILARAFHRFGLGERLVDNLGSGGGILSYIDIENGTMKSLGLIKEEKKAVCKLAVDRHPDTNEAIAGVRIPRWDEITKVIIDALDEIRFLKFVALDVVVTDTGCKILEVNSYPTLSALQVEFPVFKDKMLRQFFLGLSA